MIKLNCHPYPTTVWFTLDYEAFIKKYHAISTNTDRPGPDFNGCCYSSDNYSMAIVGVFDGSLATVVHELAHATIAICTNVGIPITDNNSESFCYLLDSLFKQASSYIDKQNKD